MVFQHGGVSGWRLTVPALLPLVQVFKQHTSITAHTHTHIHTQHTQHTHTQTHTHTHIHTHRATFNLVLARIKDHELLVRTCPRKDFSRGATCHVPHVCRI